MQTLICWKKRRESQSNSQLTQTLTLKKRFSKKLTKYTFDSNTDSLKVGKEYKQESWTKWCTINLNTAFEREKRISEINKIIHYQLKYWFTERLERFSEIYKMIHYWLKYWFTYIYTTEYLFLSMPSLFCFLLSHFLNAPALSIWPLLIDH